jgi:WD40 repeat protein
MAGLTLFAGLKVRQAEIQRIETSLALSDAHLLNNQGLEANVEAIRAANILRNPFWQAIMPDRLKKTVSTQLQQAAISGHERNQLRGYQSGIGEIVLSPDGTQFMTWGVDDTVRLWNIDGSEVAALDGTLGIVRSFGFSPDGSRLFVARYDTSNDKGTLRLWDTNGTELATREGQGDIFWDDVVFSPDGTRLATRGDDGTVRLWDNNGTELTLLTGHQGRIFDVVFSPDGTRLATGGEDGTVRLWDNNGTE